MPKKGRSQRAVRARNKGARYEREICQSARERGFSARRILEYDGNFGDIVGWDVRISTATIPSICVQSKARKRCALVGDAARSISKARAEGEGLYVWWIKVDREKPVVIVDAQDFLDLLEDMDVVP